jgi:hypothetical protein
LDPAAYCREVIELLRSGPIDRFTGAEPTEILFVLSSLVDCASTVEEFAERLALLAGEGRRGRPTPIARAARAILRDRDALTAEAAQARDPAANRPKPATDPTQPPEAPRERA